MKTKEDTLNELALFAGAGGGILGGHLLGWRTVCAVEWDAYAASILVARQNDGCLPPFPIWDDVQTFDGRPWRGRIDVISGGFPCQDISAAGKGAGIEGERSGMWRHMARIIGEVRPRYVFVENSPMLVGRGLATVLSDLAEMGYDARWGVVGAHHVAAPHKRDRIWILAYSNGKRGCCGDTRRENAMDAYSSDQVWMSDSSAIFGEEGWECSKCGIGIFDGCSHYHGEWQCLDCKEWTYPFYYDPEDGCQHCGSNNIDKQKHCSWWSTEPTVDRMVDGLANRLDRLRCIGNGQVPAVVQLAWNLMKPNDPEENEQNIA
jgi:DNA (cytosine-5)-methyltransferase 1